MSQSVKGQRDLRKLIPPCFLAQDGEDKWVSASKLNGWVIYTNDAGMHWALYRTYVDIVGWSKDDITAFTQGAAFQEAERWTATLGGTIPILNTWDMVSVNSIADSAFDGIRFFNGLGGPYNWEAPGMSGSNYNLEEILAGRYRSFAESTDVTATTQTNLQVWGAGDATAGDRIHITRAILLTGTTATGTGAMFIPPMAVIIPTLLVKEKDLVYMERLRRSYVLADNR